MQTYGVLKELMAYHNLSHGLIMGGASRVVEAQKLSKGKYEKRKNIFYYCLIFVNLNFID